MRAGRARHAMPCTWLDRLLCIFIGPGVTGLWPCPMAPSRMYATYCIQSFLWYESTQLANIILDRESALARMDGTDPHAVSNEVTDLVIAVVILVLWAVFIFPQVIEIFSLPPYKYNVKDVLVVLRTFPHGAICPFSAKTMADAMSDGHYLEGVPVACHDIRAISATSSAP